MGMHNRYFMDLCLTLQKMHGQAYEYGDDPHNLSLDMTDSELKRKKTDGTPKLNGSEDGANGVKRNKR